MSRAVVSNVTRSTFQQIGSLLGRILTRFSWPIFLSVLALTCIGILAIYLADRPVTTRTETSSFLESVLAQNYLRQLLFLATGLILFFALVLFDYRRIGPYAYGLFAATVVLLVIVRLAPPAPGTQVHRWFAFGPLRLQPSELAKITFILALAWYLRFRKSYRRFFGFLWPFAFALVPMALIVIEPDLGTSLLFLPTLIAVLFAAGARKRHIALVFLLGLLCLPLFWMKMNDYQKARVAGWLQQGSQSSSFGPGYQLSRSLIAIGTGGTYGQPWGRAEMIEHDLLVFDHTDFVFAVIAAQWGLVGAGAVLCLYLIIFACGLRIALKNNNPFGRLLAVGVIAMLAAQTTVNIAMTVGLLPITGMTLPFVSYGGSSLWSSLIAVALLISVNKHRSVSFGRKPFEFSAD